MLVVLLLLVKNLSYVLDRSPSTSIEFKNVPQTADVQKP